MKMRDESNVGKWLGFTRTDLLVLVGVVALLAALAAGSLARAGSRTGALVCQFNLGRLGQAWLLYAQENSGRLVPAFGTTANPGWANGALDYTTAAPDNTNTLNLTRGRLWTYVEPQKPTIYRCPDDASRSTHGGQPLPRVRSYAMNAWLNGTAWTAGYRMVTNISTLSVPTPARTFVLVEEQDASLNDGMFIVDMRGYPSAPSQLTIIDLMSARHESGANLTFGDGHVEFWQWRDARTLVPPVPGQAFPGNISAPNNLDISRMQAITGVRP
jgi:prepilin-type processing-associated H-X9-DG protein